LASLCSVNYLRIPDSEPAGLRAALDKSECEDSGLVWKTAAAGSWLSPAIAARVGAWHYLSDQRGLDPEFRGSQADTDNRDACAKRRHRKGRGIDVVLDLAGLLVVLPPHALHHIDDLTGVGVDDGH
jgi:hypothetical protein